MCWGQMFVSHDLSSFLLYLYVSTLVQCKNCLAWDKSFLAIPTMLWLNRKKWFVLRHAKKHCHNHGRWRRKCPPNAPYEALRLVLTHQIDRQRPPEQSDIILGVLGSVWPSMRSFVLAMMHLRNIGVCWGPLPPQPRKKTHIRLLGGRRPLIEDDGVGRKALCAAH
jgi:hypothetical protein